MRTMRRRIPGAAFRLVVLRMPCMAEEIGFAPGGPPSLTDFRRARSHRLSSGV